MHLKQLTISNADGHIIRKIKFHVGLNLIVDNTPSSGESNTGTGNNVGKTTVLKLVDFCLGRDKKAIYVDPENARSEHTLVKEFLSENGVLISLILKDDLRKPDSKEVLIERNFLLRNRKIQRIDGQQLSDSDFDEGLTDLLFPGHYDRKPTFRQIIAHNIRYTDFRVTNTLKHLDRYTSDVVYETLHLFLLGCNFEHGQIKQELLGNISMELRIKKRLESPTTKSEYTSMMALVQSDIDRLQEQKRSLNLNPNFESDMNQLNRVKAKINSITFEISKLEIRKELILEAQGDLTESKANVDLQQLRQIYQQATTLVVGIQKTFDELHEFHNEMVESKLRFIVQDLPRIDDELRDQLARLQQLRGEESDLVARVIQGEAFDILETVIGELTELHQQQGRYQNALQQLENVDAKIDSYRQELEAIDDSLFSDETHTLVQEQVNKFNEHFASVSNELYSERYALRQDIITNKKGQRLYQFRPFNLTNFSSGKKQGEIACFDIAYTLFADQHDIPCMHFLLNDKKELMHDNQLVKIASLVKREGIQFVASMLKDKLPPELDRDEYKTIELSQDDKLFRIESKL